MRVGNSPLGYLYRRKQMADIQHSELPSNLCHEPKGAAEAGAGTVYVADGVGSGSFRKIPLSSLSVTTQALSKLSQTEITEPLMVDGNDLSQIADGVLRDVEGEDTINKNTAELYRLYMGLVTTHQDIAMAVEDLQIKINEIIAALKDWGIAE